MLLIGIAFAQNPVQPIELHFQTLASIEQTKREDLSTVDRVTLHDGAIEMESVRLDASPATKSQVRWPADAVFPEPRKAAPSMNEMSNLLSLFDALRVRPFPTLDASMAPGATSTTPVDSRVVFPLQRGAETFDVAGTLTTTLVRWTRHEDVPVAEFSVSYDLRATGEIDARFPWRRAGIVVIGRQRVLVDREHGLPVWIGERARLTSAGSGSDTRSSSAVLERVTYRL